MRGVILSNCAHHIVFGRGTLNDQKIFSELGGTEEVTKRQDSYSYNSLSSSKPSKTTKSQYVTEEVERVSKGRIREKDFQEITCYSVKDGRPLEPFSGKVSFLSKKKRAPKKRYRVDWEKLFYSQKVHAGVEEIEKVEPVKTDIIRSSPIGQAVSSISLVKEEPASTGIIQVETNISSELSDKYKIEAAQEIPETKSVEEIETKPVTPKSQLEPEAVEKIVVIPLNQISIGDQNEPLNNQAVSTASVPGQPEPVRVNFGIFKE
jgi:hypothetical protein